MAEKAKVIPLHKNSSAAPASSARSSTRRAKTGPATGRRRATGQTTGTAEEIEAVAHALNTRPRKVLGWKTPAEAFDEQLRLLQQPGVASTV